MDVDGLYGLCMSCCSTLIFILQKGTQLRNDFFEQVNFVNTRFFRFPFMYFVTCFVCFVSDTRYLPKVNLAVSASSLLELYLIF